MNRAARFVRTSCEAHPLEGRSGMATTTATRASGSAISHPATLGRVVLWTFVVVNVAIVETLWLTGDPAVKSPLIGVARLFGLNLALLIVFQLLLVARIPWLERRVGMDRLTAWHRWVGFGVFWMVLLHPTLMVLGYSRLFDQPFLRQIADLAGVTASLLGMIAASIILVVVAFSVRFARRRLGYETWHTIHMLMYAAVTFAIIHQLYEGTSFRTSALAEAYWWLLWGLTIAALIGGRLVTPLVRNARHKLRVAAVVPESDNVVSVYVEGRDLAALEAKPGQFFIWRFLAPGMWWQANPFSLSAAPDGRHLRLTAKGVGRTSRALRHLKVGTRVYAEGPYGAFTSLHRSRPATLLVAGGVGVTPIRALLEELSGPITVLYRVRDHADAVLLRELDELARARGATLHVLAGRTSPTNQPFDPRNLVALVPDLRERDVFVCGPPPMTDAVLGALRTAGVPRAQVHAERFSLAGGPVTKG
jgi:predicted ferric reductase